MTTGRILVTGASRGIGKATALALLEGGNRVVLHAGTEDSLARAYGNALDSYGDLASFQAADLSDLDQVEAMCRRLEADGDGLDVLVNNAAVVTHALQYSAQGVELQFAVNHLAGFYLANRLLPLLASSGARRNGQPGRIVQVSSIAHGFIREVGFSPAEVGQGAVTGTDPYDHRYHYYRTKLANVLFVREWARRVPAAMVCANALHPGIVRTRLSREYMRNPVFRFFESLIAVSPEKACATSVFLATADEVDGISGSFYKASRCAPEKGLATDPMLGRQLWESSLLCLPATFREHLSRAQVAYEQITGLPAATEDLNTRTGAHNE